MEQTSLEEDFVLLREFLTEKQNAIEERWRIINQYNLIDELGNIDNELYMKIYEAEHLHQPILKYVSVDAFLNDVQMKIEAKQERNKLKGEDFQFFTALDLNTAKPERTQTREGIRLIHLKYHETMPVYATDDVPETGFKVSPDIQNLVDKHYPQYKNVLLEYCRPLGTTDAAFDNFNRAQRPSKEIDSERNEIVIRLIKFYLNVKPYRPIHYEGTPFARLPLSTGTGYFDRASYKTSALADLTRPETYKEKPTSKGHKFNATYLNLRSLIHNCKAFQIPYRNKTATEKENDKTMAMFIAHRPTMMFVRNHISLLQQPKARPVYNVDPMFLKIETMLTYPALIQSRPITSCIMYSLETIRGGCHYLDNLAKEYLSYFTIDWSCFDQTLPSVIIDKYYTDFLESLIVISKGYQPTITYQHPSTEPGPLYKKMSNLLTFLHTWYKSMVFITADGYGYQRTSAGVPSGMLNTQYLDSFGNLYLILDGLLEFGFSEEKIKDIRFFIMGDDNSGFTRLPLEELEAFISWFEQYARRRWNMKLSQTKSIITALRHKIEILSYQCNFGMPKRPIQKLVAQLCYPERQMKPKYMSYRAIGMAYAAAGSDITFHNFL